MPRRPFPQPPLHPPPQTLNPVVVANPVAGTGATSYPADPPPPITSLCMLRSQPPFAWKLDLPGRKRGREEFMATTWEVELETQEGPPRKISFPSQSQTPGEGGRRGRRLLASTHTVCVEGILRMDCCVQDRAGVPEGKPRRLAALRLTGVRGWGDRAEEHMSYGHNRRQPPCGGVGRHKGVHARQGPVTVQQLARWACKRALSALNYVHTLGQRFRRRNWRA